MHALLRFALALTILTCGCSQAPQPAATPANAVTFKPTLTTENDGIVHEFYRDVPLEDFMKTIPSGSVDAVHLHTDQPMFVIVLATAKFAEGTKPKFNTTFSRSSGAPLVLSWEPTPDGSKSGSARALFVIDAAVTGAETKSQ